MRKINFKAPFFKISGLFLVWKLILIIALLISINIPLGYTDRFLGGGPNNYKLAPGFFSWANFDGEHYLSIAIFGYKSLQQAFFPLYPLLISFFGKPFSADLMSSIVNYILVGILISNISFYFALLALWKLLMIDFSKKLALLTIFLIIIFPTSFYFSAVYNESLFLLLTVLAFVFARKGNWFLASFFGMLASSTRVFGILLLPTFIIEAFLQKKKSLGLLWLFLIPLGLGAYMYYQYLAFGDPFAFYNLQELVGEQRQSGLVILPQTYYRYLKMLLTVDIQNPIYQTIILEFICGILFLLLPIYGYFKKIRLSYLFYALAGFLIASIQGSFSSVPRYVIVFFPAFMAMAIFILTIPKFLKVAIIIISAILLIIETALFLRGYWVA